MSDHDPQSAADSWTAAPVPLTRISTMVEPLINKAIEKYAPGEGMMWECMIGQIVTPDNPDGKWSLGLLFMLPSGILNQWVIHNTFWDLQVYDELKVELAVRECVEAMFEHRSNLLTQVAPPNGHGHEHNPDTPPHTH